MFKKIIIILATFGLCLAHIGFAGDPRVSVACAQQLANARKRAALAKQQELVVQAQAQKRQGRTKGPQAAAQGGMTKEQEQVEQFERAVIEELRSGKATSRDIINRLCQSGVSKKQAEAFVAHCVQKMKESSGQGVQSAATHTGVSQDNDQLVKIRKGLASGQLHPKQVVSMLRNEMKIEEWKAEEVVNSLLISIERERHPISSLWNDMLAKVRPVVSPLKKFLTGALILGLTYSVYDSGKTFGDIYSHPLATKWEKCTTAIKFLCIAFAPKVLGALREIGL